MSLQIKAKKINSKLVELYPEVHTELEFKTPFQLLVATILSAQSTDKQVNKITSQLFARYRGPEDFAGLKPEELQHEIKGIGLHRNKSRFIVEAGRRIVKKYGGKVPRTREELMQLPGVGRKTANVVLSNAFGIPALGVDTHVHRVANRLGLVKSRLPQETEEQLMKLFLPEEWHGLHHRLIYHGRQVCLARNPRCRRCPVAGLCTTGSQTVKTVDTGL